MKTKLKLCNRSRRNNLLYLVLLYLPLLFCLGLSMHKGSTLASFVICVICLLFDIVILSNLMYINQGCALRKISGSPSGSQAFYLRRPDLKVGRPNKNFGEPFGLPSIPAGVPRPLKLVARVHLMRKFCTHMNLTGLLITKLGNFSFWVRQKPACCLMKPIKVFVPFRFKTRNVSNAAELFRF